MKKFSLSIAFVALCFFSASFGKALAERQWTYALYLFSNMFFIVYTYFLVRRNLEMLADLDELSARNEALKDDNLRLAKHITYKVEMMK